MRRIAVVIVAATLLAGCGQRSVTTTPVVPTPEAAAQDPRAITIQAVEGIMAQARLPSGTRAATTQEATGKDLGSRPVADNLVDRHSTYVVPLGFQEAISWFAAHPPPDLRKAGTSSQSGPDGQASAGEEFDGRSTLAYNSLAEQVAVFPLDDAHAVVRVDGLAVWLPVPTRDERVPRSATAVHVVRVVQMGSAPVRVTLTGSAVQRLARVVNRQRPTSGGAVMCPNDDGARDVLHFTGGTPDPVFRVGASGCGFIDVTTDGVRQPVLGDGFAVDRVLRRILSHRR
jgi:hypothetical protein